MLQGNQGQVDESKKDKWNFFSKLYNENQPNPNTT